MRKVFDYMMLSSELCFIHFVMSDAERGCFFAVAYTRPHNVIVVDSSGCSEQEMKSSACQPMQVVATWMYKMCYARMLILDDVD